MSAVSRLGRLSLLWITLLVVALDQITKNLIVNALPEYGRITIIPGYFDWTHVYNPGAAFSLLAEGSGWQRWLFTLIALGVSLVLVIWLKRLQKKDTWLAIGLTLILGGALGNLYDRIALGHVVDFILVHWHNQWFFPAFNIADCAITLGAILLIGNMLFSGKTNSAADEQEKPQQGDS